MTLTELVTSTSFKFEENTTYYSQSEIVLDGINPAMRLISMTKAPLPRRASQTISTDRFLIDLRETAPRLWRINRVVVGVSPTPTTSAGSVDEYHDLHPTRLSVLEWKRNWLSQRGRVTQYWRFGDHWMGVHKRPTLSTELTIMFDAMPLAYTADDIANSPSTTPELPASYHPLIADVAYALLIIKEGVVETERAEQVLQQNFGAELTRGIRRVLHQQRALASAQV